MAQARGGKQKGLRATFLCFAAGLFTASSVSLSQAAECFQGPDFQAPPGARWQYQRDAATNKGCWYVEGVKPRRATASATRSPRPREASAVSQSINKKAAPRDERPEMPPAPTNQWFSPKFWGVAGFPNAYSDSDQEDVKRSALTVERSRGSRAISKAIRNQERQTKIAQRKPTREQHASGAAHDRSAISALARLEAAGDKPVPGLATPVSQNLKQALEAVGDKDVVPAPAGSNQDWQQALYEEFLEWRLRQVLQEKARTIRQERELEAD